MSRDTVVDNIVYWVGKNAKNNWEIIGKADVKWAWFHLDKFPSTHVIINKNIDEITDDEIQHACYNVWKWSKIKLSDMSITYTEVGNLKLGEDVGSVYYKSNGKTKKLIFHANQYKSKYLIE